MSVTPVKNVSEEDLKELKSRMKLISDADPLQYHNEFSLKRYLRAFKTVDAAFQAILKTNKWKVEYDVASLTVDNPIVKQHLESNKARVLRHRDMSGRPVIYIPAKNHDVNDRDIDEITKFIVYCLEEASKKCFEEVVDNLCIVFDLRDFGLSCMDYQMIKNLIWLLSRHYPERLGVCLITNAPTLFSGCWAVIKGWLDDNTSSKVIFINSEEELCKYLIPDILPDNM
ncbi:CRAL-TRIO domain-containing protein C3H8.02 [Ischnura elegans]|uniref:CRAL-TRIO domain-containing protein C3H8.02 n=1 Tax=Ischnura elegans TaxID=197161 RepID=UPI001ED8A99A|nr:CRAL-TRIO domain-containing protein C3H8.02 [Ischnura elegans]XP_046394334.1 CRAL-TRIO domain-containing protein C3H8.02 [Ischnura elegans]